MNPADAPILIISITSDTYDRGRMYDVASSILQQKLSQVDGVGQVTVGGSALPGVRVDVNPTALNNYGLGLEDIRTTLGNANANEPKGWINSGGQNFLLHTTDQLMKAKEYAPLVIAYRNGAPIRVADVANVTDSVEDIRTAGLYDDKVSVSLVIFRQPGANMIETVDRVLGMIPQFQEEIPAGMKMHVAMDRTTTIRASVRDVEITLGISTLLVILVVFIFLRSLRTTRIPSVAVPVSLVGTFGVMYLAGYSLDNLSLMALAIATGFVVDDAIVVIENISRHLEHGMKPLPAAAAGGERDRFHRSFHEHLAGGGVHPDPADAGAGRALVPRVRGDALGSDRRVAAGVAHHHADDVRKLLKSKGEEKHGKLYNFSENIFGWILHEYEISLKWVMRHQPLMLGVTLATIGFTVFLYKHMPTGFFPQQDTGRLTGTIQADQDTSFQSMSRLLQQYAIAITEDPAVENVVAFTGGQNQINTARMFVALKPLGDRGMSADEIMKRLRGKTARIPGAQLILQSVQDLRIGGRASAAQYQYTLQSESLDDLNTFAPQMLDRIRKIPGIVDANTDQQNHGLEATLTYDRTTAKRLGVDPTIIDNTLYDAFGQRQVSTMYAQLNQYHVVEELDPKFWQNPDGLKYIYLPSTNGTQIPLSAVARFVPGNTPLAVNHSAQFPSVTISFNLLPGVALGDAVSKIEEQARDLNLPPSIHGSPSGTAQAYKDSLSTLPLLIITALLAVYIVLGILYESYIHPLTILSTIPSAGVGALLALLICHVDLSVVSVIGILLLIGIVKKNAIA